MPIWAADALNVALMSLHTPMTFGANLQRNEHFHPFRLARMLRRSRIVLPLSLRVLSVRWSAAIPFPDASLCTICQPRSQQRKKKGTHVPMTLAKVQTRLVYIQFAIRMASLSKITFSIPTLALFVYVSFSLLCLMEVQAAWLGVQVAS
ncbi:hypothetical protein BC940DRAFT_104691 [Gongronella butleri]|nr:hypothetical protein BC940DRAFT_104691 [Gongronella butleri]